LAAAIVLVVVLFDFVFVEVQLFVALLGLVLIVLGDFLFQVLGFDRHVHREFLTERGDLVSQLDQRGHEILQRRGGRARGAGGADDLFAAVDQFLGIDLETGLAFLAGEIDGHLLGARYKLVGSLSMLAERLRIMSGSTASRAADSLGAWGRGRSGGGGRSSAPDPGSSPPTARPTRRCAGSQTALGTSPPESPSTGR